MGRRFNAGVISDKQGTLFPNGLYHVKVDELKEIDNNGALAYDLRATVIKPEKHAEEAFFQRLFIGTDDDPQADDDNTQRKSRGLRFIKRLCAVTEVEFDQDADVMCEELKDKELLVRNRQRHKEGEDFNNLVWAFALGDAEPEIFDDEKPTGRKASERRTATANGSAGPARPTATKPTTTAKPATKSAPAPANDGFELEEVE